LKSSELKSDQLRFGHATEDRLKNRRRAKKPDMPIPKKAIEAGIDTGLGVMEFPLTLSMNDCALGIFEINIVAVPLEIPAFVIVNPPIVPESVITRVPPACAAALARLMTAQAAPKSNNPLFIDPPVSSKSADITRRCGIRLVRPRRTLSAQSHLRAWRSGKLTPRMLPRQ
jgi:hypothetical protein